VNTDITIRAKMSAYDLDDSYDETVRVESRSDDTIRFSFYPTHIRNFLHYDIEIDELERLLRLLMWLKENKNV
jgi:hypothetical protein